MKETKKLEAKISCLPWGSSSFKLVEQIELKENQHHTLFLVFSFLSFFFDHQKKTKKNKSSPAPGSRSTFAEPLWLKQPTTCNETGFVPVMVAAPATPPTIY